MIGVGAGGAQSGRDASRWAMVTTGANVPASSLQGVNAPRRRVGVGEVADGGGSVYPLFAVVAWWVVVWVEL